MTVTTPPRTPEIEHDRDLEQRVADLEALIEEARRRARRRRSIYAAIVLTALGAAAWALLDIGGNGGVSLGRSEASGSPRPAAAQSAAASWRALHGPEGGGVLSLAVDPADARIVYAGGSGNVFKSTDGGGRWRVVSHEPWTAVSAITIDPTRPDTVYAGIPARGVGKSVDGGRHWRMVNAGLFTGQTRIRWGRERWIPALLVDPSRPQTVYALVSGGLFRTTDGGGHWRFVRPRLGRFWFLSAAAVDPTHPGTVYASWTSYGVGSNLYKTADGGNSWQRIAVQGSKPSFTSLVIGADAPGTIFATDDAYPGIYTSNDGGTTWSVVTLPLRTADGLHVVAGSRGTFYAVTTSGAVFTSKDGGATWEPVGTEASLAYGPIAVDPQNPETLYGSGDGVVKSIDGGHTWAITHNGLVNTGINALVLAPGSSTTLYAGAPGHVYKSTNRGRSWRAEIAGLGGVSVATLAVVPHHPRTVFAGASGGLFESVDGGLRWRRVQTGSSANVIEAFAVDPQRPSTIYVGACRGGCGGPGSFMKTIDGGATWRPVAFPGFGPVQSLAIDPRSGSTIFAGTTRGGLFRSTNGGRSWRRVALAHGVPEAKSHIGFSNALVAIAVDPLDPDNVYAGVRTGGILKSSDGGKTWAAANTGLRDLNISTLAVDPRDSQVLFMSAEGSVYRSTNGGENWQPYRRGLPAGGVDAFAIDPAGRAVFAGTNGDGVVALRLGG